MQIKGDNFLQLERDGEKGQMHAKLREHTFEINNKSQDLNICLQILKFNPTRNSVTRWKRMRAEFWPLP